MRENDKNLNAQDDQKHIVTPVIWAAVSVAVLIGILIWFGVKDPVIFGDIRDLLITSVSIVLFLIGTVLAALCFILASRLKDARKQVDESLSKADGKVEELAVKIEEILRNILNPFIQAKAKTAGIMHLLHRKKTEE